MIINYFPLRPDPISCNHFVECSNGSPFRKICPAGLHFDIRIKACNWPESMECSKHSKPLITERPPTRPSITERPPNRPSITEKPTNRPFIPPSVTPEYTGVYPTPPQYDDDKNNNMNFNRPHGGNARQPVTQTTSRPSTPSNNQNNCEWCFKCPNHEDEGYYENKYDKYTYYHCFEGNAYLMYCPRDSAWTQRKQICESERLNNKNEDGTNNDHKIVNPFKDEDDGTGLIDARMKSKNKSTTLKTSNDPLASRQGKPQPTTSNKPTSAKPTSAKPKQPATTSKATTKNTTPSSLRL